MRDGILQICHHHTDVRHVRLLQQAVRHRIRSYGLTLGHRNTQ